MSFTAEEIWENLPGERASSVFLAQWYEDLPESSVDEEFGDGLWRALLDVRQEVNRAMETKRAAGELKGSLDAEVELYASPELAKTLESVDDELRFVLITSEATVLPIAEAPEDALEGENPELRVRVVVAAADKCERCWHRRIDVGSHEAHPTLCGRCVTNVEGDGEIRRYA